MPVQRAPGRNPHAPCCCVWVSGDVHRSSGCQRIARLNQTGPASSASGGSCCVCTHHLTVEPASFLPLSWEFKRPLSSSAYNQRQGQANRECIVAQVTAHTDLLLFKNKCCLPGAWTSVCLLRGTNGMDRNPCCYG